MVNKNYKLSPNEIRNIRDPIREQLKEKNSLIIKYMQQKQKHKNEEEIVNRREEIKKPKLKQKSKKQKGGATYLPQKYYNTNTKLPNPKTNMETAYGKANPVSGIHRNLAPFPNSSGIQTGGNLRKCPSKKAKEFSLGKKQKGEDGKLWVVSKRSGNVKYWKRV